MKEFLKKHYVGLTAGVIAIIALAASVKGCDGNEAANTRIDEVAANVDSLTNNQNNIISVVNNQANKITENTQRINALKERMDAVEDSIDVHREEIDSLKARVDTITIAKRQEKCPCINPKAKKPAAKRPVRPNNVPARRDTVVVVVKEEPAPVKPVQNANGCGDDQNANVVIHGNNNSVTISNNGKGCPTDTTKTVTTRRVSATANATLVVNTVVTRSSYCH